MNFGEGREVDHHTPYGDELRQRAEVHFDTGNDSAIFCIAHGASRCPLDHHIFSQDIIFLYILYLMKDQMNLLKHIYTN